MDIFGLKKSLKSGPKLRGGGGGGQGAGVGVCVCDGGGGTWWSTMFFYTDAVKKQ